jgi:hypothetical protein
MLRFLHRKVKRVTPKKRIKACRDPADNYLLEIAVEARASFLVSGDDDLLALSPVQICTDRELSGFQETAHGTVAFPFFPGCLITAL